MADKKILTKKKKSTFIYHTRKKSIQGILFAFAAEELFIPI